MIEAGESNLVASGEVSEIVMSLSAPLALSILTVTAEPDWVNVNTVVLVCDNEAGGVMAHPGTAVYLTSAGEYVRAAEPQNRLVTGLPEAATDSDTALATTRCLSSTTSVVIVDGPS